MATQTQAMLNKATKPDTSGSVFPEPYSVKATNDVWDFTVTIFNDTSTRIGIYGCFKVPNNYVQTAKFNIYWTSTAITGNAVWEIDYRAVGGNDTESMDQTGNQESLSVTDAAPGAAQRRLVATMTATSGNFAAGDLVEFEFFRNGASGSDTMAAAATLFDLEFEYSDT
jgi:hypothetical protein